MNEEEIKETFNKDPFFMLILGAIFFGLSDWEIPQNEKIQEMIENLGGNENA